MTRPAIALLALLCAACATHAAPNVTPQPRPTPLALGLNDGYHGPLPADIVARVCTWRAPWLRTPHLSADTLAAFVASIAPCPQAHVLALVEGHDPALAAALAQVAGVEALEVGNELELAPLSLSTAAYAAAVAQMHDAAREAGFTGEIIAGAVYALTDDTKRRVEAMLAACPDCAVGLHVYEMPSADDLAWIRALGRRVWVTETGASTGCGTGQWQAQADYVRGLIAALSSAENVVAVIGYQRPSGPTCSGLDTFGWQAADGTWKPVEGVLR